MFQYDMDRNELERLQYKKLKETLVLAYNNNINYRKKFNDIGVKPDDIRDIKDVSRLFFTTKQELRDNYPMGFNCVDKCDIARIHMSGGTTGVPVIVPYTKHDIDVWGDMVARCLSLVGVERSDIIQIAPAFGLWNGGFGFHYGAERLDCFTIPIGPGNTRNQIKFMQEMGTTVFCSTSSYPLRIAEVIDELSIGIESLNLKKMVLGAEPWSDGVRSRIESFFGVDAYDIPGLTETGGVGTTGMECPYKNGLHIWEDNILLEIIDPETGEVLEDGEEGEIVYTTLSRKAMPLIRYRSGEVASFIDGDSCECGLPFRKISRIRGRVDDMIIHHGAKFYPHDIERVLTGHGVSQYSLEARGKLSLRIESDPAAIPSISKDLKEFLGISPSIEAVPYQTLKRYSGKTPRLAR